MTPPLTPRENLTRPIVGIENRTAHEVFDIMSDRFRAHLTALASGSGDHAELARSAEEALLPIPEKRRKSWFNRQNRFRDAANPATVLALLTENAALRAEHVHLVEQKEGAEDALFNALSRATEADRKLAEAVGLLEWARDELPEINPSNYDHDDACHLNAKSVEVTLAIISFLSKEAERG